MLGQNLKSLYESLGAVACTAKLGELLTSGEARPEDFSFRELAESFCGSEWVRQLSPNRLARFSALPVMEAGEGVDVSAFSNITGQLLFTKILDGWKQSTAGVDSLYTTVPSQFDGEKFPFLGRTPDEGFAVRPGELYQEASFGERYIETPATTKYGMIVSLTKEMIFFDRTNQALMRAGEVGERLGMAKAKRLFDEILGLTNSYKLNGTSYNTYLTSGGWINKQASTPLVDWTSIEQAYLLSANILDPDTGNPIDFDMKQLLVMPAKLFTAKRIVSATEIRSTAPGFATSGNPQQTSSGNPLPDSLEVVSSKLAYRRLIASGISASNAADYWFVGDFKKAFWYVENWPITVVQAPPNNTKDFEQDIVHRVKASERGVPATVEPRCVFEFYNA